MAKSSGMIGGTSTDSAGIAALSAALTAFSAQQNVGAISSLNSQLQTLAKSMNIPELPNLIAHLERMKIITKDQADELRKLNPTSEAYLANLVKTGVITKQQAEELSKVGSAGPGFITHLKGIGSAIAHGNLGGAVAQIGPAIGSLGGSLAKMGGIAAAVPASIVAVGAAIQGLVNKANPGAAFQFNRALDDLAATFGQILTPILQGITVFVRDFADGLQGLKPAFAPLMQGIGGMIAALGPLLQSFMQLAGPAFQAVGYLIANIVVPAFKLLADGLREIVKVAMDAISFITAGLISFDDYESKSSVGAAIRPAAYSGIEDIGKRTTLAALNQTDKDNVPRKIDKSNELLQKILDKIGIGPINKGGSKGGSQSGARVGNWIARNVSDLF